MFLIGSGMRGIRALRVLRRYYSSGRTVLEIHTMWIDGIWGRKEMVYSLIVSFSFNCVASTIPTKVFDSYGYTLKYLRRGTCLFPVIYFTCPAHGPHPRHTS